MDRRRYLTVCDLPLELLLKIFSHLSFPDVWYFGTCSQSCQTVAQQLILHKYHVQLGKRNLNAFNYLIHSAMAYIIRHGYTVTKDGSDVEINQATLQFVSNRLAVEIYDMSPQNNWEHSLEYLLDKVLGIITDHVLLDPSDVSLPKPSLSGIQAMLSNKINLQPSCNYAASHTGRLISNFLATFCPTLIALFDTEPASTIHHRLLLNHLNRHLDVLTQRYHQYHRHRMAAHDNYPRSASLLNPSARQSFRLFVRFIGTLVQNDLITASDLQTLTHQQIVHFFLSKHAPPNIASLQSQNTLTAGEYYQWRLWIEEIEFQMAIVLDLMHAVICRQYTRWDSGKELNVFTNILNDTLTSLITSTKAALPSTPPPF